MDVLMLNWAFLAALIRNMERDKGPSPCVAQGYLTPWPHTHVHASLVLPNFTSSACPVRGKPFLVSVPFVHLCIRLCEASDLGGKPCICFPGSPSLSAREEVLCLSTKATLLDSALDAEPGVLQASLTREVLIRCCQPEALAGPCTAGGRGTYLSPFVCSFCHFAPARACHGHWFHSLASLHTSRISPFTALKHALCSQPGCPPGPCIRIPVHGVLCPAEAPPPTGQHSPLRGLSPGPHGPSSKFLGSSDPNLSLCSSSPSSGGCFLLSAGCHCSLVAFSLQHLFH